MRVALVITQESVVSLVASVYEVIQHSIRIHADDNAETASDLLYAVTSEPAERFQRRFSFIEHLDTAFSLRPDWIFVPALNIAEPWMPECYAPLIRWLRKSAARGAQVTSVGTGSFLLAEAGLLPGGRAVTHSHYANYFRRCYPALELRNDLGWVRDRKVACSGDLPWQELLLATIAEQWGARVAQDAADTYALHWDHLMYQAAAAPAADACVSMAQRWLSEHYAEDDLIPRCLEVLGLPRRTFNRRFKHDTGMTPIDYVQQVRIQTSQGLLAFTDRSVEDICYEVGYADIGAFYKLFRRHTGVSPGQFRRTKATA